MILHTYRTDTRLALGIKTDQGIVDAATVAGIVGAGREVAEPESFFRAGWEAMDRMRDLAARALELPELAVPEHHLPAAPCVPAPGKIICIGLNYKDKDAEGRAWLAQHGVGMQTSLMSKGAAASNTGIKRDWNGEHVGEHGIQAIQPM